MIQEKKKLILRFLQQRKGKKGLMGLHQTLALMMYIYIINFSSHTTNQMHSKTNFINPNTDI